MFHSKKELIFITLAMFFAADAITAELIGGKLIHFMGLTLSIGVIPWPVIYLATDVINEFYGKKGVRRLSIITACLIAYTYIILYIAMSIHASSNSPISDSVFANVFGQSMWLIVGSLVAFVFSQLVDNSIFWMLRKKTGHAMIWLRSTGSTIVSQLVDTFIVLGIGFWLQGKLSTADYLHLVLVQYLFKITIAIIATPLIYGGHNLIFRVLGKEEAHSILEETAKHSLGDDYIAGKH